jgi:hypothetical protein
MRNSILLMVGVCLVVPGLLPAGALTENVQERALEQKLQKKIPQVKLVNVNFEDAVDFLRGSSKANIYVNWAALEIDQPEIRTQRINVVLNDVTVERALQLILKDAGAGEVRLGYAITDGVINISARERLGSAVFPRTYYVGDLVAMMIRECEDADTEGSPGFPGRNTPTCEECSDIEHAAVDEASALTSDLVLPGFMRLLTSTVDRESWYPNGNGTIHEVAGCLVITQTEENHRKIREFLGELREQFKARQFRLGLAVVRMKGEEGPDRLRHIAENGSAACEALLAGKQGQNPWILDRALIEDAWLGIPIRTSSGFARKVESAVVSQNRSEILTQSTNTGYLILILPVSREKDVVSMEVSSRSAWLNPNGDPGKNTPESNTGTYARRNRFNFPLRPGEAKLLPVTPLHARGGGVMVLMWLPKEGAPGASAATQSAGKAK